MKRIALAAVAVFALAGITATAASESTPKSTPQREPVPTRCQITPFRAFSAAVWRLEAWERGRPPERVLAAQRRRLSCAPPGHRAAMVQTWERDRSAYFAHRAEMLFRERVTPYFCVGQWWATECTIPLHESGYGSGGGNLYGMLDAWALHGCTAFAPTAWDAPKRQQDICAHRHWVDYGRGGWPPY
jgi:hypothetical protein